MHRPRPARAACIPEREGHSCSDPGRRSYIYGLHTDKNELDHKPRLDLSISYVLCCKKGRERESYCGMAAAAAGKKLRKPYTITRPREKWTADEHDRFLHALLLFGRDWKRIEQLVATKTATQPPSYQDNAAAGMAPPLWSPAAAPPPMNCIGCTVPSGVQQSADWACASAGARWPDCNGEPSEAWIADAMFQDEDETIQLPLSPDDLRFAQVYRFVGDVFGSGAPRPVEAQLQRLQEGMDPLVVETILLVLRNLEDNLCA